MSSDPARPVRRRTDDGRPVREVLTYTRRGSRISPRQQEAWDTYAADWVIPEHAITESGWLERAFGRPAPTIIEVGSGNGEATVELAADRPGHNILAFEVWRPGIAATLSRLAEAGLTNVRLIGVDAVWALEHAIGEAALAEIWTFFPDPWPKKKHHKRRFVRPDVVATVARRLAPGGVWRLATDWVEYAGQMREVLDAEPLLEGGTVPRWADRPLTKFERRGIAAGHVVADLEYRRRK